MDQYCHWAERMGSTWRKYTRKSAKWQKELSKVVLEQSGSSTAIKNIVNVTAAAAVQRLRVRWTRTDKIKKYVTGSQLKEIWSKIIYCPKEQNLAWAAGATAVLWYPAILLGFWFPDFPCGFLTPVSTCFVCGVAPNLRILWICWEFSTATACAISCCFSCPLSSSQVMMHYSLSTTVCICTPCQGASFPSETDSFLRGHGPDTLTCKARPSLDWLMWDFSECVIVIVIILTRWLFFFWKLINILKWTGLPCQLSLHQYSQN